MPQENTNDFDELRRIVEHDDESPERDSGIVVSQKASQELDDRLMSVARAQQEAGLTLSNVVLR